MNIKNVNREGGGGAGNRGEVLEPSKFPLSNGNTSIYPYSNNIHNCVPSIG